MDYEKKYKEALERARIYHDNAKAVEEYAAAARYENIFPELREKKTLCEGCIHSQVCRIIPFSQENLISCSDFQEKWKPSYEQMVALRRAVNKLAKTDVADSVRLSIMYDHLKREDKK